MTLTAPPDRHTAAVSHALACVELEYSPLRHANNPVSVSTYAGTSEMTG